MFSRFCLLFVVILSLPTIAQVPQTPSEPAMRSRGNTFNPDLSVNTLLLFRRSNRGNMQSDPEPNGFSLQELELQATADVDPYFRLVSILAVHEEETEFVLEPEEVFAESLQVPTATIRVGKFKAAFGRHNLLHTHAFPFIDAPVAQTVFLGEEGLNDTGLSVSYLAPAPWFLELTGQALSGQSEASAANFGSRHANDVVGVLRLRNLWETGDESTLELSLSGANGENVDGGATQLAGVDTTFKWRPLLFGNQRSITWSSEFISRSSQRSGQEQNGWGYYTFAQLQFLARWWVQARHEYLQSETRNLGSARSTDFIRKNSALMGYLPSEFSALRLQYDHINDGQPRSEQRLMLQVNLSIGAHPAHLY